MSQIIQSSPVIFFTEMNKCMSLRGLLYMAEQTVLAKRFSNSK